MPITQPQARQERHIIESNRAVRAREYCKHCGSRVSDEQEERVYAGAGGVLEGPFCNDECMWGWLTDGE